jgi:hypothetical protein
LKAFLLSNGLTLDLALEELGWLAYLKYSYWNLLVSV